MFNAWHILDFAVFIFVDVRRFLLAIIFIVSFISSLCVFFLNIPNRLSVLTSSGPINSERQKERRQINLPELRQQTNNSATEKV